jgi:ketosteroid isomerase-like protein
VSQENVEIVRGLYDAFETRDNVWPFEVYDAKIEWYPGALDAVGFEPVYRGHDGVRAYWRNWLESWESIEFRLDDLIDAGDEVVALIWQRNRGASGAVVEYEYAQVWTLRDGMVPRQCTFVRREDALKAVRLSD